MSRWIVAIPVIAFAVVAPALAQEISADDAGLKQAARAAFAMAEPTKARELLQALLERYQAERADKPSWQAEYQYSRRLAEVAGEYLRATLLADAMVVLGEMADLDVPLREGFDNGWASAAGGWHRQLAQLESDERYELLHEWSMPTESRRTVRALAALVPTEAPPADFARALGERARDSSFQVAGVSEVSGLFSSAWELVRAAEQSGHLRRLTAKLEELAVGDVKNAAHVLTLARIVQAFRRNEQLEAELSERLSQLVASGPVERNGSFASAWKYGYGTFQDGQVTEFTHFPFWTGGAWQFTKDRPDPRHGFIRLDRTGGHPGMNSDSIRRWIAPSKGVIQVSGILHHPTESGDGVLGRIVSSSAGAQGEWLALNNSQDTNIAPIEVEAGDTIDFVLNKIGATGNDSFIWICEVRLETGGRQVTFNTVTDFRGPHESSTLHNMVLAAACLEHDWLQPIAERSFEKLVENTYDSDSWMNRPDAVDSPLLRPALRRAWATAVSRRSGRNSKLLDDAGLQSWVATSDTTSAEHAVGHSKSAWLAHENRLMHLAGPRGDTLMFRYPLTGEFTFSLDTQAGGRPGTDGGVAYGGLRYLVDGCEQLLKISDSRSQIAQACPHIRVRGRTGGRHVGQAQFNRLALTVAGKRVLVLSNGEAVWSGERGPATSPWLGLHALGDRMPVFLGLEITGNPVVPREVRMSGSDSLYGWAALIDSDRLPRLLPEADGQENEGPRIMKEGAVDTENPNHFVPNVLASHILARRLPGERVGGAPIEASGIALDYDWFGKDGIIHGARREGAGAEIAQSQLRYCRPLRDGESISYEFVYEPERFEVHPTLGRLAFLIEPDGVRLHWITDGNREWTGLSEDNAVVVPLDRRGPKPLPLVKADWNRIAIAIDGDKATLTLNEQFIYQRELDAHADRSFGLYHDACRTAAQVKNVVMRGDWPERLSVDGLNALAAVDESKRSESDRNTLSYLFQEKYLSNSVIEVVRHAATLADEERYDYLIDWVLPTKSHSSLRLAGKFSLLPVMPLADQQPLGVPSPLPLSTSETKRLQTDVQLIAPAFDLVNAAKRLGRLDELRRRLASGDESNRVQALQTLMAIAAEDFAAADQHLDALISALDSSDEANLVDLWPEMLAAWIGMRHPETQKAARHLIEAMHDRAGEGKLGETDVWRHHLEALAAVGRFRAEVEAFGIETIPAPLQQWQAVSHVSARSRGEGRPVSRWQRLSRRVDNISAHDRDYLYFQSPLRGNFQVECDIAAKFGTRESHLAYAGTFTSPWDSRKHYGSGSLREPTLGGVATVFDPYLTYVSDWMRYRLKVEDGRMSVYFSGRLMREEVLPDGHDPWLAVRNHWERAGAVRDVRITGQPVIPETIDLLAPDISVWLPYYGEAISASGFAWQLVEGELIGQKRSGGLTNDRERLLHYHRPMLEDGTIEYEFFFEPGATLVHPALDRLVFLLDPGGVRLHWATHGQYDLTGLDRANAFDEPESRRGPDRLPFVEGEWNKASFKLAGNTISIMLNGEQIFERQLEPTNLRTFGLFHCEDTTKARVRNVVWRGDWPRELPTLSQQELTDVSIVESLAEHGASLPKSVEVDFRSQGLPKGVLGVRSGRGDNPGDAVRATPQGLLMTHDGELAHNVGALFGIRGDFDITMSYSDFKSNVDDGGGTVVHFYLTIQNQRNDHIDIRKSQHPDRSNYIEFASSWDEQGRRGWTLDKYADDGHFGVARLIRRGNVVYCLTAADEQSPFRLWHQFKAAPGDLAVDGFRVDIYSWSGKAQASIVLEKLTVRAEQIIEYDGQRLAATLTPTNATGKARYVRVDLPNKTEVLSLAEVEVMSDGKNVALKKPATQSSVGFRAGPERAVDGNRNGHFHYGLSTTHTVRAREPWWEVDLRESYDVERVRIWNRSDYGWTRLDGFRVQLLDEDRNLIWEQTPQLVP